MIVNKRLLLIFSMMCTMWMPVGSLFAQSSNLSPKVLVVVSSLDKKTEDLVGGFWFPELTHPVAVFDEAGITYDIASPKGGLAPFDGFDLQDKASLDFWTNPVHRNKLGSTIKLSDVDASVYSAVLLIGGHGPMWDFVGNTELNNLIRMVYESGGIISAVCHGPAGLLDVTLSNGKPLIQGRALTAFTAEEEIFRKYDSIVPFELEASLKAVGAQFEEAPIFESKVVVDGRLISGQNPASATALGEALVNALKELPIE